MIVTMSTVRSNAASLAAWPSTAIASPPARSDSASAMPGPRLLEPPVRVGAGRPPEQVAVEAHVDVVVVDLDAVVPQPVAHRRQPPGLQLVRAPQLVERSVHQDDARHGVPPRSTGVSRRP